MLPAYRSDLTGDNIGLPYLKLSDRSFVELLETRGQTLAGFCVEVFNGDPERSGDR